MLASRSEDARAALVARSDDAKAALVARTEDAGALLSSLGKEDDPNATPTKKAMTALASVLDAVPKKAPPQPQPVAKRPRPDAADTDDMAIGAAALASWAVIIGAP